MGGAPTLRPPSASVETRRRTRTDRLALEVPRLPFSSTTEPPHGETFRNTSGPQSIRIVNQQRATPIGSREQPGVVPPGRGVLQRDRRSNAGDRMRTAHQTPFLRVEVARTELNKHLVIERGLAGRGQVVTQTPNSDLEFGPRTKRLSQSVHRTGEHLSLGRMRQYLAPVFAYKT